MCNINILIKKKGDFKNIAEFIQSVTSASFLYNNHGEGVFISNGEDFILKNISKINYLSYKKEINKGDYIITHQRIATSGFSKESIQPLCDDNFIFVHNGILHDYEYNREENNASDSYNFFQEFIKKFNKIKEFDREKKIKKSLYYLLNNNNLHINSYSIAFFDKKTKTLYYLKNKNTFINFYRFDRGLFITTEEKNSIFLNLITDDFRKIKIKNNSIYKIKNFENKIIINKICRLKENDYSNYNSRIWFINNNPEEEIKEQEKLRITADAYKCSTCGELTHYYNYSMNRKICYNCLQEEEEYPK